MHLQDQHERNPKRRCLGEQTVLDIGYVCGSVHQCKLYCAVPFRCTKLDIDPPFWLDPIEGAARNWIVAGPFDQSTTIVVRTPVTQTAEDNVRLVRY
jgi:hypothetical protein